MAVSETAAIPTTDTRDHIPALDGLRGLAVLLVLFNHAQVEIVLRMTAPADRAWVDQLTLKIWSAWWSGVDLFFVLSGFLITRILLQAKSGPGYFRTFYARRALRIFPLYYLFLVFLMALTHWRDATYLNTYGGLFRHQVWFWSYLSNYPLALSRVFDIQGFPATHLWTLAIEEQFYLVWPLIVLVLGRRNLMAACVAVAALALGLRIIATLDISEGWAVGLSPYYLTPMKLDTLAIGALIACLATEPRAWRIARKCAPAIGLIALAWLVVLGVKHQGLPPQPTDVSTFGFSALALLFGSVVVLIIGLGPDHAGARLLSGP
ncbi:MAG: acyltransferase, partial [Chloroflexi bacterium]|nr:acyltransferase [Chloroflexota bacterium]